GLPPGPPTAEEIAGRRDRLWDVGQEHGHDHGHARRLAGEQRGPDHDGLGDAAQDPPHPPHKPFSRRSIATSPRKKTRAPSGKPIATAYESAETVTASSTSS